MAEFLKFTPSLLQEQLIFTPSLLQNLQKFAWDLLQTIAPHSFAIRFLGNKLSIEDVKTRNGKMFSLLNLPYFAISQLDKYIEWGMNEVANPQ